MQRFRDKIVLVTGAASGIGKATALRLAEEGASVACVDIDGDAAARTAEAITALDRAALALSCDVSNEAAVQAVVEQVVARFGKLDVLCNIAGILRSDHTHELKLDDWQRVLSVNLTGTFLMCRAAIPHLLKTRGNIVNMSSTAALGSHPWMAAYAASKGGILSMSRALSVEYVKQGLRVNAICPGGIKTGLHQNFSLPKGADFDLLKGAIPFVEFVGPEQIAAAVAFVASDEASYMNGEEIRIDGGAMS
ncbi:MAG TPA: SDR family NAD(P)-dependent oxidoreductase [Polyangiaceae bacterium]|nr:SDR family NAD(P)-dependent oxidoreductase [Polyangiaceae bacterium]